MPQLSQLSDVILSQLFWLALTLGFIYFVIGRGMLPKIMSTVDRRDSKIAEDLAAAEDARVEADKMEEVYRLRIDATRGEAMKLTAAAKQDAALRTEKLAAKADASNKAKLERAQARIRAASEAARGQIAAAAAEMTRDVAAKVAGLKVSKEEALKAVERAHG